MQNYHITYWVFDYKFDGMVDRDVTIQAETEAEALKKAHIQHPRGKHFEIIK
jgi:hypothetical protein